VASRWDARREPPSGSRLLPAAVSAVPTPEGVAADSVRRPRAGPPGRAVPAVTALGPSLARTAGQRAEARQPLGLILVPTSELAQVIEALAPYARSVKLRLAAVVGGMSIGRQASALRGDA